MCVFALLINMSTQIKSSFYKTITGYIEHNTVYASFFIIQQGSPRQSSPRQLSPPGGAHHKPVMSRKAALLKGVSPAGRAGSISPSSSEGAANKYMEPTPADAYNR